MGIKAILLIGGVTTIVAGGAVFGYMQHKNEAPLVQEQEVSESPQDREESRKKEVKHEGAVQPQELDTLSAIEKELKTVLDSGETMSPERFKEIKEQLHQLAVQGEDIETARSLMLQIAKREYPGGPQGFQPGHLPEHSPDSQQFQPPKGFSQGESGQYQRPVLALPWDKDPYDMLPMGETESHDGEPHVGIDFFFRPNTRILAAAGGEVIYIKQQSGEGESHAGLWDVFVQTGRYTTGYTELERVNPTLTVGSSVQKGDWIGDPNHLLGEEGMIHWEFGYSRGGGLHHFGAGDQAPNPERLCPVTYFDENSRKKLEAIWQESLKTWHLKDEFPYICSGIYEGKHE